MHISKALYARRVPHLPVINKTHFLRSQVFMSQPGMGGSVGGGGVGRSPLHRRSLSLDASSVETSRIPIPSSSPRALLRQGSFKMRSDGSRPPTISEWEENKPIGSGGGGASNKTTSETTTGKLKRHRSLVSEKRK